MRLMSQKLKIVVSNTNDENEKNLPPRHTVHNKGSKCFDFELRRKKYYAKFNRETQWITI